MLILVLILYLSFVSLSRLVFAAHFTNHLVTGFSLGYLNFSFFLFLYNSDFCDIVFNSLNKNLVYYHKKPVIFKELEKKKLNKTKKW